MLARVAAAELEFVGVVEVAPRILDDGLDRLVLLRGLGDLGMKVRQAVHRVNAGQVQPFELSLRNLHADQATVRVLARCGVDSVDIAVAGGPEDKTFPVRGEDAPERAQCHLSDHLLVELVPGRRGDLCT